MFTIACESEAAANEAEKQNSGAPRRQSETRYETAACIVFNMRKCFGKIL